MIRNIVNATEPRLRDKSKPVLRMDKKVLSLIKDLKETLVAQTDPEGVGLAAPQIGKNVRVFVMRDGDKIKAVTNPKIISISQEKPKKSKKAIMEGCLSVPHHYGPLTRAPEITIEYLNQKGEKVKETFTGFPAQIVQHEIDHLNGVLFIDRLLEAKKPLYELIDDEWYEVDL